jgi:hypothetical protein
MTYNTIVIEFFIKEMYGKEIRIRSGVLLGSVGERVNYLVSPYAEETHSNTSFLCVF